jgi:hypothetical protein
MESATPRYQVVIRPLPAPRDATGSPERPLAAESSDAVLRDVQIVEVTELAIVGKMGTRRIMVPLLAIVSPRPMPLAGATVTIVVEKWFAMQEGWP